MLPLTFTEAEIIKSVAFIVTATAFLSVAAIVGSRFLRRVERWVAQDVEPAVQRWLDDWAERRQR